MNEKQKMKETVEENNCLSYHSSVEESIVKCGIGFEQLASQQRSILNVFEEGDIYRILDIMREVEGSYVCHSRVR